MDVLALYAQYAVVQHLVQFVIAIIVFAVQVVALQDAINASVLHVAALLMTAIHVAQYAIALHVDAIFEHAHHVIIPVIIFANYEILIRKYFIYFFG